jgi:hypothetical protein
VPLTVLICQPPLASLPCHAYQTDTIKSKAKA